MNSASSVEDLELAMACCVQSRSKSGEQTVLGHGISVQSYYEILLEFSRKGQFPPSWRAPRWWTEEAGIMLADAQPSLDTMRRYLRYHDCGKPFVHQVDDAGRSHFPNHAEASANAWRAVGGTSDEVWMIRHDMLLHTGSASECEAYHGHRLMPALLFAALAEIHANAEMFGGIDSSSFKAKAKQLDRRGGAYLRGE